jgi:hypothetical protein
MITDEQLSERLSAWMQDAAADVVPPPGLLDGIVPARGVRPRPGLSRRVAVRLALAAVAAAAILLGALSFSSNDSPSGVQPAAAAVLRAAAAELDRGPGTILHTVMTESYRAGPNRPTRVTLIRDSWLLQSHPYTCSTSGCPFIAYRQIDREPGAPVFESSTNARGITDLYDAATNTIYLGPPQTLKNVYPQMLTPANMSSGINPSSPAFGDQLRALVHSGDVRVIGDITVNGQRTIAILGHSRVPVAGRSRSGSWTWTYYVAPRTYRPIEFKLTGFGTTAITGFDFYEQLSARGHMSIFNLATQHPGARIDRSSRAYQTASSRMAR